MRLPGTEQNDNKEDRRFAKFRKVVKSVPSDEIVHVRFRYSKPCFVRPLVFSTENGRKKWVSLQMRCKISIKFKELDPHKIHIFPKVALQYR